MVLVHGRSGGTRGLLVFCSSFVDFAQRWVVYCILCVVSRRRLYTDARVGQFSLSLGFTIVVSSSRCCQNFAWLWRGSVGGERFVKAPLFVVHGVRLFRRVLHVIYGVLAQVHMRCCTSFLKRLLLKQAASRSSSSCCRRCWANAFLVVVRLGVWVWCLGWAVSFCR